MSGAKRRQWQSISSPRMKSPRIESDTDGCVAYYRGRANDAHLQPRMHLSRLYCDNAPFTSAFALVYRNSLICLQGRKDTAVKVYTIVDESRYLIVRNLPALGAHKELLEKVCSIDCIFLCFSSSSHEWRLGVSRWSYIFCDDLYIFNAYIEALAARSPRTHRGVAHA